MTQELFKTLKEWVEKVTNYDFHEGWAHFDEDGAYFSAPFGAYSLSMNFNNDESVELWLISDKKGEYDIKICETNDRNAHLCTNIFSYMVFNN